jgi:quinol monooxygenase YgiN
MIARVAAVQVAPERVDEVVRRYRTLVRPVHEGLEGLRNHYVIVDRQSGQMKFIGLWASNESVDAARAELEPARRRLWDESVEKPTLEV